MCVCVCVCVCVCRYDFCLKEDEKNNQYLLEVAVPRYICTTILSPCKPTNQTSMCVCVCVCVCVRYMDTTLIECDVQPTYVRLKIKGKVCMYTLHPLIIQHIFSLV